LEYNYGEDFKHNFIDVDVNPDELVTMVRGASHEEPHHRV